MDPFAKGIARGVQPGFRGVDFSLHGGIYFSYDGIGSRFDGIGGGGHGRICGVDRLVAAIIAGRQHEGGDRDGGSGVEEGRLHVGDL